MGKTATKILTAAGFIFIWIIFGYQFFFKGLVPAPLDFLNNFYNPWQGYQGHSIKNSAIPDVVSQIIPWKMYTVESFKEGRIPFWNPYNFSGTPHLANFQSAIFNPVNFLFLLLPFPSAWSLYILGQPLLAGIFTYLFTRKMGISRQGSYISSLCFAFCGFLTVWLEYGTLGWAIVWLPFVLYELENFWENKKAVSLLLANLGITFSILSGHLQISLYLMFTVFLFTLYSLLKRKINGRLFIISQTLFIIPFLYSAVQLIPTLEYYRLSPRGTQISEVWFKAFQMPISQLLTFIFPDYYGNPVTRNEWGVGSYVEMMGYIGFLPIILIAYLLLNKERRKGIFFFSLALFSILLALPTPLSLLLLNLKVPVLSSSSPSRIICLVSFSLSILAGLAWDSFSKSIILKKKMIKKYMIIWLVILTVFLTFSYFLNITAFRNSIINYSIFILFFSVIYFLPGLVGWGSRYHVLIIYLVLLVLSAGDLFRFWTKFNPFTDPQSMFSAIPVVSYVKNNAGNYRVYDLFTAELGLPFDIYSIEGYDSLTITPYQQLLAASQNGDPTLPDRTTGQSLAKRSDYSKKLVDLLGIKYITSGKSDVFAFPTWIFPDSFNLVWEDSNYRIFENKDVLPRFFMSSRYRVASEKEFLAVTLSSVNNELVLTQDPKITPSDNVSTVTVKSLKPEKIVLTTKSTAEVLLFYSDTYYPGWQAKVDNSSASIYRTDFAFRSVKVPAGEHTVEMTYYPRSFKLGLAVSLVSFSIFTAAAFFLQTKVRKYQI